MADTALASLASHVATRPVLCRLGVVVSAFAIYRLGSWIPLPGGDAAAFLALEPATPASALGRVSIMALGVGSWLSALLLVEFAMTIAPPFRRWAESGDNRSLVDGWIAIGALALAGFQANNIAIALEDIGSAVATPGLAFRAGVVGTMVAATAFLIWLASVVNRFGVGSGFLLLLAAPYVLDLPGLVASHWLAMPSLGAAGLPLLLAVFVIATAGIVFVTRALGTRADPGHVFWPPLVAYAVATAGIPLVLVALAPHALDPYFVLLKPGTPFRLVLVPLLTAGFFMWRLRSLAGGTPLAPLHWIGAVVLGGVVALCEAMMIALPPSLALDGRYVVIIVVFALGILAGLEARTEPEIERTP